MFQGAPAGAAPRPAAASSQPQSTSETPFHFDDPQVVLQVEGQTYKIHRYFLTRESVFFNDLFTLPQPGDSRTVEGSDDNPIKIPETPIAEFESLLRFFYFGMHKDYVASLADWIAMLSISTRFIFEKVCERAVEEITARLDEVEPFRLIELAFKYDQKQWLKSAYRRIVTRINPITQAEAAKLSPPMALMFMRSREQYRDRVGAANANAYASASSRNLKYIAILDPIIDSEVKFMELALKESDKGVGQI